MAWINWPSVFEQVRPQPGASKFELQQFETVLFEPLSHDEIHQIRAEHRAGAERLAEQLAKPVVNPEEIFVDPAGWKLPAGKLPPDYLDFLHWSNGGSFRNGTKWFWPAFGTDGVRNMMLGYEVPIGMPGALPFAFDGGGTFYLFDMRLPPRGGEYPVLVCHASCVSYAHSRVYGESFLEACRSQVEPMGLK